MGKKRCKHCRQYGDAADMVVYGLSAFCSNEHFYAHQNEPSAPKPKKNTDKGPSKAVREEVATLDDGMCRMCGARSGNLVVHHIIFRSQAPRAEWLHDEPNLITLCNYPCHIAEAHGKEKDKLQKKFVEIVKLRAKGDRHTTVRML